MKKSIPFILMLPLLTFAQTNKKPIEILVIGTFHFNNPGLDVSKFNTFDIMAEPPQKQLDEIADAITKFKPSKVFTEWELKDQLVLDTLYGKYLDGSYLDYVTKKFPKRKFYTHNEIVQLAFRTGKKSKLTKIHGIDYTETSFDYDSLMKSVDTLKQPNYKKEDDLDRKIGEKNYNDLFATNDLLKCLFEMNTQKERMDDISWYISKANSSDTIGTYVGAYLSSEWYRRNLYMLANIQKITESTDQKVMVLAGSSHIAMIAELLKYDANFKVIELKDIMLKK